MKSAGKLFVRRLRDDIRYQFRAVRMVVDWTIMLYFVVPAIIFVVVVYVNWWLYGLAWMDGVPFGVLAFALCLLLAMGEVRLFVEEADIVFLNQTGWVRVLKRSGMIYSFVRDALWVAVCAAILLPFLVLHYELFPANIIVLFVFSLFTRELLLYAYNYLSLLFNGFILKLTKFVAFIGYIMFYLAAVLLLGDWLFALAGLTLLMGVLLYFIAKARLNRQGSFFADVEREQREHMKLVSLVFSQVAPAQKRSIFSRKRPYILSKSQRLLKKVGPENGLAAMHIKRLIRSGKTYQFYWMFTGAAIVGILIAPHWLKWLIWIAELPLLADWFRGQIKGNEKHSFLTLWRWKAEERQRAAEKTISLMLLVNAWAIGIVFGLTVYSWTGAIVMIPVSFLFTRLVARVMTAIWS